MNTSSADLLRIDPLTGCKNFLGFLETSMDPAAGKLAQGSPAGLKVSPDFSMTGLPFSAVLFVSMNALTFLNETKGSSHGDSAIRWMGILLQEETRHVVYRFGAEFAVFLKVDSEPEHVALLERILERMNREAKSLEFPGAPADVALIFNQQTANCLDSLLLQMSEAMARVKNRPGVHHGIFHSTDFEIPAWTTASQTDLLAAVRWIIRASILRVFEMGKNLELAQQDAFTDAISNLPNMRAVYAHVEECLRTAQENDEPLSILFIDGDNFRIYNNRINYAAGDQMIRDMSAVLKQNLRANDFVGRWRNGDEFVITLPDTTLEDARVIGERFRLAVREASQHWRIPITISIGISSYPANGADMETLMDQAENAKKRAKDLGKDQVVLAG
jgi:diguanylate cyclase (GGDEF)-like protein